MTNSDATRISTILEKFQNELLDQWIRDLKEHAIRLSSNAEQALRESCSQFLRLLTKAIRTGGLDNIDTNEWADVRHLTSEISKARAKEGSTPTETALFIFSLKQPLFACLRLDLEGQPEALAADTWAASLLLDRLGLYTIEVFQRSREQIIARQQQEMLELSTPVVKLWQNILALPLIGTLDSARTQIVMESLLEKIVETGADIAIIDISGVPMVDTLVAQHLLKTVSATRLMGADCIISGIRPQIAQTIVQLGVNLEDVVTKATLADAFLVALERSGNQVSVHGKPGLGA